jgi:hypothetical protein
MELNENSSTNILNPQNNTLEYVNLDNLDYEYLIEEFLMDINRFEARQEEVKVESKKKDTKEKKDSKKDSKGGKKGGAGAGKKKKPNEDDLNLSKQSSKLSIYSTKAAPVNKTSGKKDQKDQGKVKLTVNKCGKSFTMIVDKNKLPAQVVKNLSKNIQAVQSTQAQEEEVVTSPIINNQQETEVENNLNPESASSAANAKKNKKTKKEKENLKKPKEEEPQQPKPTKPAKKENTQENKRVEDFLKSVKEKKGQGKTTKKEEKVSLKNIFLDKHKYLFTLDPSQRLRLRELAVINTEVIENFFCNLLLTYESFEKFAKEEDYIKTNIKDASIIIDNLAEMCVNINKPDLLTIVLDKSLSFAYSILKDIREASLSYYNHIRVLILNILYSTYKYFIEASEIKLNLDILSSINKDLQLNFSNYLNQNFKNPKSLKNLKEDEDILFYAFSKSLSGIIISLLNKNSGKELDKNLLIDENINLLLSYIQSCSIKNSTDNETEFEDFLIEYSNLKFFTKFSHLFDLNKSKFYNLSIKASRSIESQLVEIQNLIIKSNEKIFSLIINKLLIKYIQNFSEFYEAQESLYDDIFNLLKFLVDDKIFSNNFIQEIFSKKETNNANNVNVTEIKIHDVMLHTDDMTSKFIQMLIKYIRYFEKVFYVENTKDKKKALDEEIQIFLNFFHQVLAIVLNLKQGYLREKYFKIMEKTIETHLDDPIIAEKIFEYITDVIRKGLLANLNMNLIQNIKNLKDLIKFYSNYYQIKKFILKLFDAEIKQDIEFSLFSIFYLNFLNLKKEEDFKLLDSLIKNSSNFVENILFIDRKLCSYLTKYYINEEISSLENIINLIFDDLSKGEGSISIPYENLVRYILIFTDKIFSQQQSQEEINLVNNLTMVINIIEKFLCKRIFDLEKFVNFIFEFLEVIGKYENKNEKMRILTSSIITYFLNRISQLCDSNEKFEKYNEIINMMKDKLNNFSSCKSISSFELVKEIQMINDNLKKPNPKDYLKSFDQLTSYIIELLSLEKILKKDPNYFNVENILIENVEIKSVEKNANVTDLSAHYEENQILDENLRNKIPENKVAGQTELMSVNNKENVITTETSSSSSKINLDIILHIFKNYISHINTLLNNSSQTLPKEILIFNLINFQETINLILSNNTIFYSLINNTQLLEDFIKSYLSLKERAFELGQSSLKDLRRLESDSSSHQILERKSLIQQNLNLIDLSEKCALHCGNFVKYRCREQIVYLFKEEEIYKMFLTKDREFLKFLFDRMDSVYKSTIINESNVKSLIAKAQNEEEDLLEEVVHSIFSKQVINYLECPEEIIEFLSTMNDALRYDLKVDRREFYNSLFSYFYLWKTIMSKIENGFKLYTTDKQYVNTIDTYKTLLKFVINYLERNTKLYEMFLLLVVSLIHLIDDEKSLEEKSSLFKLNEFDDSSLSDFFDHNTYQFLLSVLYKFVKIFPSLVKFYYDESKTKLKNIFKQLNSSIILPNMLLDLKERINLNVGLLSKYQIRVRETKSLNYIEFEFAANEEIKFMIDIKIPNIFPLKKLDINFKSNALIDERKLLNVKMNLNQTMNSSIDNITDNLIIWSENVMQLVVVGQEPCPVCYSYLHGTDKSLPCSTCKTCKKKFHSLCVKEWFKSLARNGQQNTCPMCRSEWKGK